MRLYQITPLPLKLEHTCLLRDVYLDLLSYNFFIKTFLNQHQSLVMTTVFQSIHTHKIL